MTHQPPRPPGPRLAVHLARVAALTAALTALTTLVVADVIAAEPIDAPLTLHDEEPDSPFLTLIARPFAPDAAPAPQPPDLLLEDQPPPPKKPRRKKSKFGRFEGY
jgi:hypothetical protein